MNRNLQAGSYRVCVQEFLDDYRDQCAPDHLLPLDADQTGAPYLPLASGEDLTVTMHLVRGARISGEVASSVSSVDVRNRTIQLVVTDANDGRVGLGAAFIDANGEYRVGGLPDGGYRLVLGGFEHDSPVAFRWSEVLYPAIPCHMGCDPGQGTIVLTDALAEASHIDFMLTPGAVVRGQVRSAVDASPLEGVQVQQYDLPFPNWPSLSRTTVTDSEGRYELAGIDPTSTGTLAAVNDLGFQSLAWPDVVCFGNCGTGVELSFTSGLQAQEYDFVLQPGEVMSGRSYRVLDDSPLDAAIHVYDAAGNLLGSPWTDEEGHYALPALPAGQYYLMAQTRLLHPNLCVDHTGAFCTIGQLPPQPSFLTLDGMGVTEGIDFAFPIDIHVDGFE